MKKIFALVITVLLSFATQAEQFDEGKHYQVLGTQKSSTPQLTEYFSFYCPHCNNFEPIIEKVKETLPENTKFEKIHVSFMGGSMGVPMAKAYATMVILDAEKKMVPVMFNQIHKLHKAPRNEAQLRQIFINNGIDGAEFDAAFNSFVVSSMQSRFDKSFQTAGLRSVPSVLVNNKYLIVPSGIKSVDEYIKLVHFLLKK